LRRTVHASHGLSTYGLTEGQGDEHPGYAVLWSTAPFTLPVLLMHADLLRLVCCCFIAVAASLVGERAGAQANCSLKYRRRACTMITPAIRHPYDQWRRQDFVTGGGSEVWVHRGSRVRSPPEADTFTAVHSSMTVKAHTLLHNFWTSTHRGEASPHFPLAPPLLMTDARRVKRCLRTERGGVSTKQGRI